MLFVSGWEEADRGGQRAANIGGTGVRRGPGIDGQPGIAERLEQLRVAAETDHREAVPRSHGGANSGKPIAHPLALFGAIELD